MNVLNWYFLIVTLLVAVIISITFWSRRPLKFKVLSLSLGTISFLLIYGSLIEILSRAKPKVLSC